MANNIVTFAAENADQAPEYRSLLQAHLMEYPIYKSGHEAFPKISNLKTAMFNTTSRFGPAKRVVDFNDQAADSALNVVDRWFPCLKETEVSDLTDPVTKPYGAAKLVFVKSVLEPSAQTLNNARRAVHDIKYDSNGRDVFLSWADPAVAPLNTALENATHFVFPKVARVTGQHSSELSKTGLILLYTLQQKKEECVAAVEHSEQLPLPEVAA